MVSIDLLRQHNEKLRLSVEPHVGQGDWVYALSGWHPQPQSRFAALAETAAWALILFKTRQIELIYRARSVLAQILQLQDKEGLFPRYLHEVGVKTCVISTYRLFLVMKALLQWHESAVGSSLFGDIQESLEKILSHKEFQELLRQVHPDPLFERGVMPAHLARSLLGAHVMGLSVEAFTPSFLEVVGLHGLNWLQKPKGLMPDEFCWLDVWFELEAAELDKKEWASPLNLCHLWTSLIHVEGVSLGKGFKKTETNLHLLFREMPSAVERRGKSESCFLSIHKQKAIQLRAFADHVSVQGAGDDFLLVYDPEKGAQSDEDHPWVQLKVNHEVSQVASWSFNDVVFSALKMEPGIPLEVKWGGGAIHATFCSNFHAHLRQHPSLRKSGKRVEQTLYFTPADFKQAGQIRLQIKMTG